MRGTSRVPSLTRRPSREKGWKTREGELDCLLLRYKISYKLFESHLWGRCAEIHCVLTSKRRDANCSDTPMFYNASWKVAQNCTKLEEDLSIIQ